jgi:hypothetical protein
MRMPKCWLIATWPGASGFLSPRGEGSGMRHLPAHADVRAARAQGRSPVDPDAGREPCAPPAPRLAEAAPYPRLPPTASKLIGGVASLNRRQNLGHPVGARARHQEIVAPQGKISWSQDASSPIASRSSALRTARCAPRTLISRFRSGTDEIPTIAGTTASARIFTTWLPGPPGK